MKIVLAGTFGLEPKGTVSMRAIPLGLALSRRGHDITVVVPPWDNPGDSGREFRMGAINVINVKVPRRIPILWYLVLTYRMLRVIYATKPDIVHCFKPKGFSGLVADTIWFLKKVNLTRVRLVMDTDDLEGNGGWNDIEPYSPFHRWFFARQEQRGLRQADAVTAASISLTEFARNLRVPGNSVHYIPNGASSPQMERFQTDRIDVRAEFGLGVNPVILLYTRFFEFSLSRVLSIITGVFEAMPEARLLVVGEGLYGEEKAFSMMIEKSGFADRVDFAGWVQPERLGSFFSAADIAIYPMDNTLLNRTKCPVKLIDLLAAGVPVVADRVGQTAEYIEDAKTGYLVDPETPAVFAERILRLLKDQDLRRSFGEAAALRIHKDFMWNELSQKVEEAYRA